MIIKGRKQKQKILQTYDLPKILKFPAEILDFIFDNLTAVDQLCFALTSKRLYAHLTSKNRHQSLPKFPRKGRRPWLIVKAKVEEQDRTKLLRRLEDKRWKLCLECSKLHPNSAWKRPKKRKQDCAHCAKPLVNRCMPYESLVDLCPCTSIALSHREHVLDMIQNYKSATSTDRYAKRLPGFIYKRPTQCLNHKCKFTRHGTTVITQIELYNLNKNTVRDKDSLRVSNFYVVDFTESEVATRRCPNKDAIKWLEEFFGESHSLNGFVDWTKWYNRWRWVEVTEKNLHSVKIRVVRNLGSCRWGSSKQPPHIRPILEIL